MIIGNSVRHKSKHATAIYSRLGIDPVRDSLERATAAMRKAGGIKAAGSVTNLRKKAVCLPLTL